MNDIQIFQNEQFGQVRIATNESNEPQFCLADVCKVLDLTPNKVVQRLEEGVLSKYPLETAGGIQQANFVNEDGLYDTILDSRKPEAKQFRKWITSEVLPSIRKHGAYMLTTEEDTSETIMAKAVVYATLKIKEQANTIDNLQEQTELQKNELYKAAPKVAYYDAAMESKSTYSTTVIAKDLGMDAAKLNSRLNELGVQYKQSGTWYLYAKYQDKNFTRVIPRYFVHNDGTQGNNPQTRWTEKGREFIVNLRKEGKI